MHTKDRLAEALRAAGLPGMAESAAAGQYDDYLADDPLPILTLVSDLAKVGTPDAMALRLRVIDGEFDATAEESEAWAASPEGQAALGMLLKRE